MRGSQDLSMVISARIKGWDPNEIVGKTYDPGNTEKIEGGIINTRPEPRGPESSDKTMAEVNGSYEEPPTPHNYAGPAKHENNGRHYPGKPL